MSEVTAKCDTCGDTVPVPNEFDQHNQDNYVRHVFLSHPEDVDRIRIIQGYLNRRSAK